MVRSCKCFIDDGGDSAEIDFEEALKESVLLV